MSENIIMKDGKRFHKLIDQLHESEIEVQVKRFMDEGYSIVFSRKNVERYDGFFLTTYSLFGFRDGECNVR